jgi:hypothetical protein
MSYALAFHVWYGNLSRRPKTPQLPGGPGAGGMDTMTMATTGATSVPCVRVCGLWRVFSAGLQPCSPPRHGVRVYAKRPGANPQTRQTRKERAPCERLCQRGQRHQPAPPAFSQNTRGRTVSKIFRFFPADLAGLAKTGMRLPAAPDTSVRWRKREERCILC